ncbi:hypothetical protein [Pigmentiphaga kullae]|uniref:hypothetical protein n=1 Tax=Pigmentiphaga kullae TaxID=151784 RepID=UPI00102C1E70|nr:hypothetical protein [Pigmentiphaga kullae]
MYTLLPTIVGLVIVAPLMTLLIHGWPVNDSVEWAAWVHMIVTVGAVGVAWISIQHQVQTNTNAMAESRRQLQHELLQVCADATAGAAASMKSYAKKISEGQHPIHIERLRDIQETFRIFLTKDLPLPAMAPILIVLREIAYHIAAIELLNSNQNSLSTRGLRAYGRAGLVDNQARILLQLTETWRSANNKPAPENLALKDGALPEVRSPSTN